MKKITLELSLFAYAADFVVYPVAILAGFLMLWINTDRANWVGLGFVCLLGALSWSLIEYSLHRFVLHHLQPFKRWHNEHHQHPHALIGTPTWVSLVLFVFLIFTPVALATDIWFGMAGTVGVMCGYLHYVVLHYGLHHWPATPGSWFYRLKRAHALHHRPRFAGYYGVTTLFWDKVFHSD